MVITRVEEVSKSKVRIYIEGEFAFMINRKELYQLKITEGDMLTPAVYDDIMDNIILRKAKLKALSLLKFMDRTEAELCNKLTEAEFTQDIIDKTITYISSFGYLNDERLASAYVRTRKNSKSKLLIKTELMQKGVDSNIIDSVFEEEYDIDDQEDAEIIAIKKAIAKKTKNPDQLEYEEKQKLIASLYRKGFDISKIKQTLGNFNE